MDISIQEIENFVKKQQLAVVSTIDKEGKPQSAVVEFGELDGLTIIIDTQKSSRKYTNLQNSPHVAIVIGWDDNITVQISAIGHELSGAELERAKAAYFTKNPKAKAREAESDVAYFAFVPKWVRYSDLNTKPWNIEEFDVTQ